jgi:hypothetical protein
MIDFTGAWENDLQKMACWKYGVNTIPATFSLVLVLLILVFGLRGWDGLRGVCKLASDLQTVASRSLPQARHRILGFPNVDVLRDK